MHIAQSTSPADGAERIELVRFSDLESRRELWTRLAARSGNIFASWEFARIWWRHFGSDKEPMFAECRRLDGEPFAILPTYVHSTGPLRMMRLLGNGIGDMLGPICDRDDAPLAARALQQASRELPGGRLLLAERLGGGPAAALGGRLLLEEANPWIEIGGASWHEYMKTRSRNLREKLRRSTRKVEREHEVAYRLCDLPERLEPDLETLLRLHRDRWGEGSSFAQPPIAAFHRDLAAAMLKQGRLRLWTMELDGEAVAAWYGFRFEGVESFYQSGRDRSCDRLSVGFLMLAKTLESAFEDELERYAFLRGNEPYKDRFANRDEGLETRVRGNGAVARAIVAVGGVGLRSARLRRLASGSIG